MTPQLVGRAEAPGGVVIHAPADPVRSVLAIPTSRVARRSGQERKRPREPEVDGSSRSRHRDLPGRASDGQRAGAQKRMAKGTEWGRGSARRGPAAGDAEPGRGRRLRPAGTLGARPPRDAGDRTFLRAISASARAASRWPRRLAVAGGAARANAPEPPASGWFRALERPGRPAGRERGRRSVTVQHGVIPVCRVSRGVGWNGTTGTRARRLRVGGGCYSRTGGRKTLPH